MHFIFDNYKIYIFNCVLLVVIVRIKYLLPINSVRPKQQSSGEQHTEEINPN